MLEHIRIAPRGEILQCGLFEAFDMKINYKSFSKDELIGEIERVKNIKSEGCRPCQEKRNIYLKQLENQLKGEEK